MDRIRAGRHAKSILLIGLRGVGKTVLINRVARNAEARNIIRPTFKSLEDRSLAALFAPTLHNVLAKLDRFETAKGHALSAWRVLSGYVRSAKFKYQDIEFNLDIDAEPGIADIGNLDFDLSDLLGAIGQAAKERDNAGAIFIDELQYVKEDQLAALITALQHCQQRQLPVTIVGAGLPQLVGNTGKARTYAERLSDFSEIGRLNRESGARAVETPAERQGVRIEPVALDEIVARMRGYPYFP